MFRKIWFSNDLGYVYDGEREEGAHRRPTLPTHAGSNEAEKRCHIRASQILWIHAVKCFAHGARAWVEN